MDTPSTIDAAKVQTFAMRAIGDLTAGHTGVVWNVPAAMWFDEPKALEACRTGRGVAWGEHNGCMACGVAAFYRNGYRASLVAQWLPALDGVVEQLQRGIAVADIVEDKLSPVGQLYCSGSSLICCAHAIAEGGKLVLGAQAGPKRLTQVFSEAGFTQFRRAAETPFNLIFEVRR
jgi:hypothetical protein